VSSLRPLCIAWSKMARTNSDLRQRLSLFTFQFYGWEGPESCFVESSGDSKIMTECSFRGGMHGLNRGFLGSPVCFPSSWVCFVFSAGTETLADVEGCKGWAWLRYSLVCLRPREKGDSSVICLSSWSQLVARKRAELR
jgi:hypothetical protein